MQRMLTVAFSAGLLATAHTPQGLAAGFAVLEQSTKRMGSAYAGSGAVADDASEVWYNPAAATRVGRELQLGLHYIEPSFEFDQEVSLGTAPGSAPLLSNSRLRDDAGSSAVVPNFAYSALMAENWYAGFTVNVPFGLTTDYRGNWLGRYQALDSEITSINVNPFLAYQMNDNWALGAGVSVNYTDVSLSQAIDFAFICTQLVGGLCPNGATPGAGEFDGEAEAQGNDVGYGYNLGVLWSPDYHTRVSLAYRSAIELDLTGDGDFTSPQRLGGFAGLGPVLGGGLQTVFTDSDVEAELTLPDTASLSLYHLLNLRTALLADLTWTGWSEMQDIIIDFENPLTPTSVEILGWEDTWRYSLGLSYEPNDNWTLRAGVAYDESPVPNARLRTPRLPDNDRSWLTFGASRELSPNASLDISYAHIFIEDTDIQWERDNGDIIQGEYESRGDNLSVSLNVRF